MHEIMAIAKNHDLHVIEDCAQAFGASYHGAALGSIGTIGAFSFNGFKTITAGDGGMLITDDKDLFRRCFAIHDQGHLPNRRGVEIGARTVIGLDFRLTELQAAVLIAQLGKLDGIINRLRSNKSLYKSLLSDIPGLEFRSIGDPDGEIATILTIFLPQEAIARQVAEDLGTKVVADSGWHVYNNMEHILDMRTVTPAHNPLTHPEYVARGGEMSYQRGMLPQTDALLNRAINIGIGVIDHGLGSGFGITVQATEDDVGKSVVKFRQVVTKYL